MELYRYLRIVRKRLWLVVLFVVVGGAAAYIPAADRPIVYRSTVSLSLNPAAPNQLVPFLDSQASGGNVGRLANSYTEFLKSRSFGALVVQELGLKTSPQAIGGAIRTQLVPDTNVFKITITWSDPAESKRIADGIADIFIQENRSYQEARLGAQAQLKQLRDSIDYYGRQVSGLRQERDALAAAPIDPVQKATALSALESRLLPLEETYRKYVTDAGAKEEQIQKAMDAATVMDYAERGSPIVPNVWENVQLAAVVALVLAVALSFLLEYIDFTVKLPEQVQELTGALPLGVIGDISTAVQRRRHHSTRRRGGQGTPSVNGHHSQNGHTPEVPVRAVPISLVPRRQLDRKLVTAVHPKAPISEAFRALRTNIQFTSVEHPLRRLLVTSSIPGEGKTLTSGNLAITLAQTGLQVILVDSDLRRPGVHHLFQLPNFEGFTSLMLRPELTPAHIDALLHTIPVPGLRILTSGPLPPNPAELILSQRTDQIMEELGKKADIVIYDTPPAGPITDAAILSKKVDGVIIVIQAGKARRDLIANVYNTFRRSEAPVLGCVLNRARTGDLGSYGYYYAYHYGTADSETQEAGAESAVASN